MRPAKILDKYKTIIFDMDGVITSEQNYWNIAALTAYELLNDRLYFGRGSVPASAGEECRRIRAELFDGDRFIVAVKEKGVNSNWDLCWLAFCYLSGGMAPSEMTAHVSGGDRLAFELYEEAAKIAAETFGLPISEAVRNGPLWSKCRDLFQEWYLGDKFYEKMWDAESAKKGKPGMWQTEDPIVPVAELQRLLKTLRDGGKTLGIATGRSRFEVEMPLKRWDCLKYFEPRASVDSDFLTRGEENLRRAGIETSLSKPRPYMFLKALYGADYDDVRLYRGDYDPSLIKSALVVGDAGSDILAAKAMGADFLAVLTGVSGERARSYFEEVGAEYILPNVLFMMDE